MGTLYVGEEHEMEVLLRPQEANLNGFSCEVLKGDKCVHLRTDHRSKLCIHALKAGYASLKISSVDSPETSVTVQLKVKKLVHFWTKRLWLILGWLALLALPICGTLTGESITDPRWVESAAVVASPFFVVALVRKNRSVKPCLLVAALLLIAARVLLSV